MGGNDSKGRKMNRKDRLEAKATMRLKFVVPVIPIPRPRQQHRAVKGKGGNLWVHNYTPASHPVHAFKADVRTAAKSVYRELPMTGTVGGVSQFVFPRPSNKVWKRKPMDLDFCKGKCDLDNLAKSFWDALNKLLWRDDRQMAYNLLGKLICRGDEQPHLAAWIESPASLEKYQAAVDLLTADWE